MYAPAIQSAEPKGRFQLGGGHSAIFLGDIVSAGPIEYRFVLVVFNGSKEPCYFVASEMNSLAKGFGGGSHFLCVFEGEMHRNLSDSDDWADEGMFLAEALRMVREKFGA